jgi:hypothetical protein
MGFEIVQPGNTQAAILARLIQARIEMDSHVARYLLSLTFEPAERGMARAFPPERSWVDGPDRDRENHGSGAGDE